QIKSLDPLPAFAGTKGRGDDAAVSLYPTREYLALACRRQQRHFSVSTRPLTNHFCVNKTRSAGGSIPSIAVAMTRFHSVAASPPAIIRLMPITVVYIDSSVVTSSGHKYWFQPKMNRIKNSAAMLGRDSGTTMSQKNRIGPAPSIRS